MKRVNLREYQNQFAFNHFYSFPSKLRNRLESMKTKFFNSISDFGQHMPLSSTEPDEISFILTNLDHKCDQVEFYVSTS